VLFANWKSYTGFRLVPKSVTLSDFEQRNGRYNAYALLHYICVGFKANHVKHVKARPTLSAKKCSPKNLVLIMHGV